MLEIVSAGLFSTIQDMGRYGYRNLGVPTSGVMDQYSAQLANALLDNDADCALIECTFTGVSIIFHCDTYIAITGAKCGIRLNHKAVKSHRVIQVHSGSILKMTTISNGIRTYLAVAGGFDSPKVLNSYSFYSNITYKSKLEKGDVLKINNISKNIKNRSTIKINNNHFTQKTIQVMKGPEYDQLDKRVKLDLLRGRYKVSSQSNRMAYRLIHQNINLKAKEIITSGVQTGTVQLTPSGEVIILMRDCQTTGGYARVLQLTDQAINQLSQKQAGRVISFLLM